VGDTPGMEERTERTPVVWRSVGGWFFYSNFKPSWELDNALDRLNAKYGEGNVRVEDKAFMRDGRPYHGAVAVWVRRPESVEQFPRPNFEDAFMPQDQLHDAWLDFTYEVAKGVGLIALCRRLGLKFKPWVRERIANNAHTSGLDVGTSVSRIPWRCRLFGHDDRIIDDPRPRELVSSGIRAGRPKLRPAPTRCLRCGSVSYER